MIKTNNEVVDKWQQQRGGGVRGGGVVSIVESVKSPSPKGMPTLPGEVFSTQPEDL